MLDLYKGGLEELTHRTYIRNIKQGIDSSIASHLEYLTSRWPREETLSDYTRRLYHCGEELCKYWALPNKDKTRIGLDNFGDLECIHEQYNDDFNDTSSSSSHSSAISKLVRDTETHNRVKFDQSMFDTLERNITLKVYSHQLNN